MTSKFKLRQEHAIMLAQLAEMRRLMPSVAERCDDFLYSELAAVVNDGPLDWDGNDIIAAEVERLVIAERENERLIEVNTGSRSHLNMCGVPNSGSCFVPWCSCHCHTSQDRSTRDA